MSNQREESNWGLILAIIGVIYLYWKINKLLYSPFSSKHPFLGVLVVVTLNIAIGCSFHLVGTPYYIGKPASWIPLVVGIAIYIIGLAFCAEKEPEKDRNDT